MSDSITSPALLLLLFAVLISSIIQFFLAYVNKYVPIPPTVTIFAVAMCITYIFDVSFQGSDLQKAINLFEYVDAHVIFYAFLPPILYESAGNMNWFVFRKVLPSAVTLALPGVLINVVIVSCALTYILDCDLLHAALGACIMSATDPVAVVANLQTLGAPESLSHLIEGESLLNDGSAVVVYYVITSILNVGEPRCDFSAHSELTCSLLIFLRLSIGGPVFGLLVGLGLMGTLHAINESLGGSPQLELSFVGLAMYGSFFFGEYHSVGVSGVLSVVTLGAFMASTGKNYLSKEARSIHDAYIEQITFFANQALFFIAGVICYRYLLKSPLDMTFENLFLLLALYVVLHVSRALMILLLYPFLSKRYFQLSYSELIFTAWGGLRGAVSLALVVLLDYTAFSDLNTALDQQASTDVVDAYAKMAGLSHRIGFYVSGIVVMTLVINGTSSKWVFSALKIDPLSSAARQSLLRCLAYIDTNSTKLMRSHLDSHITADKNWFFDDIDTEFLIECVPSAVKCFEGFVGKTPQFSAPDFTDPFSKMGQMGQRSFIAQVSSPLNTSSTPVFIGPPSPEAFDYICEALKTAWNSKDHLETQDIGLRFSRFSFVGQKRNGERYDSGQVSLQDAYRFIFNIQRSCLMEIEDEGFLGLEGASTLTDIIDHSEQDIKRVTHDEDTFTLPLKLQKSRLYQFLRMADVTFFQLGVRQRYGFQYAMLYQKVEVLNAYHQIMREALHKMTEMHDLEHAYPSLYKYMKHEQNMVWEVYMKALGEMAPRRFFYSKNQLILVMFLNIKMQQIQNCVEDGRLSHSAAKALTYALITEPLRDLSRFKPGPPPENQSIQYYESNPGMSALLP